MSAVVKAKFLLASGYNFEIVTSDYPNEKEFLETVRSRIYHSSGMFVNTPEGRVLINVNNIVTVSATMINSDILDGM